MPEVIDFKSRKREPEQASESGNVPNWLQGISSDEYVSKMVSGIVILWNDEEEISQIHTINLTSVDLLWYSEILRQQAMDGE
jgi:hypothetical protein